MRLEITAGLSIDEAELHLTYILATGPGGQNVNKVATAAQLRFDARHSPSLSAEIRTRLQALAGTRLTKDGIIVITARRFRSQEKNREDATNRLFDLIRAAAIRPVIRRATRPSFGQRQRRLEAKSHRSDIKRGRGRQPDE